MKGSDPVGGRGGAASHEGDCAGQAVPQTASRTMSVPNATVAGAVTSAAAGAAIGASTSASKTASTSVATGRPPTSDPPKPASSRTASKKQPASARELARAVREMNEDARGARREGRALARAQRLDWLERSVLGHRMPSATALLQMAAWRRDDLDAYCGRCGTTRAPFEDLRRGCGECRDRRSLVRGLRLGGVVRLGRYAPPLSQWVPAIKQRAWRDMGVIMGTELGQQVKQAILEGRIARPDCVVSVPVHWLRRTLRGIDHCAVLADEVARVIEVPRAWPIRARLAHRQTGGDRSVRNANRGRYAARRGGLKAGFRRILLVDDVRTTGATVREASAVLAELGATELLLAVCAAADPPRRSAIGFVGGPDPLDDLQ